MRFARVIIVDDEPSSRATYATILSGEGHTMRTAGDVPACRTAMKAEPVDVVVLELGLPDGDAMAFAVELLRSGDTGVIVVTSQTDINTCIAVLHEAADDCLIKPVHPGELAARVRSLHRRCTRHRSQRYRLGCWAVDVQSRTICDIDGRLVTVTRGEFDLLARLIEGQGRIVSREVLSEAVSRGGTDGDVRSVDSLVSRLRRKMAVAAGEPPLIVTAPGFGYRLGGPVETI